MDPNIEKALKIAQSNGAKPVAGGKFTGNYAVKDLVVLQEGDVLFIPKDSPVMNIPIRGRKNDDGTPVTFEGVYGILTRGSQTLTVPVTPSIFSRRAVETDAEGNAIAGAAPLCSTGSAVDKFYDSGTSLDEQFRAICDQKIAVGPIKKGYSFNKNFMSEPQSRSYYTLNFVTA
jgi:hypothetical protein